MFKIIILLYIYKLNRLKWKPIRENSIDFKVHYVQEEHKFTLNIWGGGNNHFYFADLTIDDPEMQKEYIYNII